MVASSRHPEELRQLRHGNGQRRASLEPDQDRLADEVDQPAQTQQVRQQTQAGDDQGGEGGDLRIARGISLCHAGNRGANEQGNRRCRSDGQLAACAEDGVTQPAEQIAIDAILRRQPRQRGVGHRYRHGIGGQGNPGDEVRHQPLALVARQPLRCRHQRTPSQGNVECVHKWPRPHSCRSVSVGHVTHRGGDQPAVFRCDRAESNLRGKLQAILAKPAQGKFRSHGSNT